MKPLDEGDTFLPSKSNIVVNIESFNDQNNNTDATDDILNILNDKPITCEQLSSKNTTKLTTKTSFDKGIHILGYPFSKIKWSNVFWLTICHLVAIYGYAYAVVNGIKFQTLMWTTILGVGSGIGMSVGAHRLWSHRSFKAHWLLRVILMILQTISINGSIFSYARDHRTHHKNSDTKYDPKNPSRGFFYSHIGWWMLKKDEQVIEAGNKLKFDDLLEDKIVKFQKDYYYILVILTSIIFPPIIPCVFWGETVANASLNCIFVRYIIFLHHFFTVNSLAHLMGDRIYDKSMRPTESRLVNYLSLGEGHHNYHHTFPYDYSSSELLWKYNFNLGTLFIDVNYWLGLAHDLKKTPKSLIQQRVLRTGIPEKLNEILKYKSVWFGILDWIVGFLVASWALLLGAVLRTIYVTVTQGYDFCKIVQL